MQNGKGASWQVANQRIRMVAGEEVEMENWMFGIGNCQFEARIRIDGLKLKTFAVRKVKSDD